MTPAGPRRAARARRTVEIPGPPGRCPSSARRGRSPSARCSSGSATSGLVVDGVDLREALEPAYAAFAAARGTDKRKRRRSAPSVIRGRSVYANASEPTLSEDELDEEPPLLELLPLSGGSPKPKPKPRPRPGPPWP